jgi:hypothetical protein
VNATTSTEEVPLSAEFRTKLLDFFRPHNKRLSKLDGRRCDWDYLMLDRSKRRDNLVNVRSMFSIFFFSHS